MSGVSVRMLRHYDEIGLLHPSDRSVAGYRQYDEGDLERLQRILSLRVTGMGLAEIAQALKDGADRKSSLVAQAEILRGKIELLQSQLQVVERTRKAEMMGINLNPEEMFEVFGEEDPTQHADEAEERWGETDAYKESHRRTSSYSKEDWLEVQAEQQAVLDAFIAAMTAGLPTDSEEAMSAAELHRLGIDKRFYPCSYDMQVNLAEMYLADPRFTEYYEKQATGLAQYVADSIFANALRHS